MKRFGLGDILSVTTAGARLVSPRGLDGLGDLLKYMTGGDPLATAALPRIIRECAAALLAQHPQLADIDVPDEFADEAHIWRWLAEQVDRFGAELDVAPLDPADHTWIDPIAELRMVAPHMQIIPLVVDGTDGTGAPR